jgi:hypothetical protein
VNVRNCLMIRLKSVCICFTRFAFRSNIYWREKKLKTTGRNINKKEGEREMRKKAYKVEQLGDYSHAIIKYCASFGLYFFKKLPEEI